MHWWMPLVVLAAACSGKGAELEIHSDVALERVELFLATQVCADPDKNDEIDPCEEGVGWEAAMRRPRGLVLHMADPLVIETALATPRTAVIRLEVSDASFQPTAIMIVGYAGGQPVVAAELHDVRIPTASAVHWKVQLDPVGSADDMMFSPPPPGEPLHRVRVWPRRAHGEDHVGCAVYQTWLDDRGEWKSHYYGPLDDPDCDNHEVECDAYWFDRNVGARQACLFDIQADLPGGCRIGATACQDGTSTSMDCALDTTQSNHCFDDALCSACAGAANLEACVIEQVTTSQAAGFDCTFTSDSTQLPCTQTANSVMLLLPEGCNGGDQYRLRSLHDDPLGLTTPGDVSLTVDGITISGRVEPNVEFCKVILDWKAGSAAMHAGSDVMLDVWYPNRHLFVPVHIEFDSPTECAQTVLQECAARGDAYTASDLQCL